jgi:superfamily II DNA or RNA helicase
LKTSHPYQATIENAIPKYLAEYGSVIVQAPTGSGKSHIINKTVQRIERAGKIALVLSDNLTIHEQLVTECAAVRIDSAVKSLQILQGFCYVAMTQSLRNRAAIIKQLQDLGERLVVLVDECHRNTMTPLIEQLAPRWLIGFSATPHYKWAKHLPLLYKSLIQGPQVSQLVQDGFLAHYRHIIRTGANLAELVIRGQDYSEESQERVFSGPRMYDGLFQDLPILRGKKVAVFTASIKLCEQLHQQFLDHGYKACRYHSGLTDGEYQLARFTTLGECDVIISVGSLTLGWDHKSIDTIVLWRKTTSLPLYLQMIGRGSRTLEGKHQFTVIDYAGNYESFGAWDMDRDWNELWQPPPKRRISTYAGVASSKDCPVCNALLAQSARSCFNCGYIYPAEEMRLVEGKLVEVQNTLAAMVGRKPSQLTPQELANYAKFKQKKAHAIRVARAMGEPFLREFAQAIGYKKTWVDYQLKQIKPGEEVKFFDPIIR